MIVIDSDKTRPRGDTLDANKVRVRDEFDHERLPGHAWVTNCRTIENYVPRSILEQAVAETHPQARYQPPATKWRDPLHALRATGTKRAAVNKVKVATKVVEHWTTDTALPADLKREIKRIHTFITNANPQAQSAT